MSAYFNITFRNRERTQGTNRNGHSWRVPYGGPVLQLRPYYFQSLDLLRRLRLLHRGACYCAYMIYAAWSLGLSVYCHCSTAQLHCGSHFGQVLPRLGTPAATRIFDTRTKNQKKNECVGSAVHGLDLDFEDMGGAERERERDRCIDRYANASWREAHIWQVAKVA